MSEHQDTSSNAAIPAAVAQQSSATPQQQSATVDQSAVNVTAQAQAQAQAQAAAAAAAAIGVSNAQNGGNVARSGSGEDLVCHWQGCSERCPTPEALYVSS